MMKFLIPLIVFILAIGGTLFMIPKLTEESGDYRALFKEEALKSNILAPERHYGLINKAEYLKLLNELKSQTNSFFQFEMYSDSLMIKSTQPNNKNAKETFERVFFNKKEMGKVATFENLPIRLIAEPNTFGFVVEIVKKDTTDYLKLPFDALTGPFIKKEIGK